MLTLPLFPCSFFGHQRVVRVLWNTALALTVATALVVESPGEEPSIAPVPRIPPGSPVSAPSAARFNRTVYVSVSHITNGDAEKVPSGIRTRVPMFSLALLATVSNTAPADAAPNYRLAEVGVGYAVPLNGRLTIINTEAPPTSAGIDMLGRQVLSANGRNLSGLRRVGKAGLIQVLDVDVLVQLGNRHASLVMRHFIWADPASGRVASCVWLLQKRAGGQFAPVSNPPRWLPEGTHDTRRIHVDASKFVLGLPTEQAFAMASLPPGIELSWTSALQQTACLPAYGDDDLERLTKAINEALEPLTEPAGDSR